MTTELTNQVRKLADDDWLRGDYAKRLCAELTAAREEIARLRQVIKDIQHRAEVTMDNPENKYLIRFPSIVFDITDKALGETHE